MTVRVVLQPADISRALTRISHEILESNRGSGNLLILGIPTRGVALAQRIGETIARIEANSANGAPDTTTDTTTDTDTDTDTHPILVGSLDVTMYRDDLGRNLTRTPARTQLPTSVDGKTIVLVDDVLYSGRTIRAALDALSDLGRPKAVRLAVLVDRGHRELPIRADFVGKNLPSSALERINVRLAEVDGEDFVSIEGGEA